VKVAARKEAGLKGKSARHKQLALWLKAKYGPSMKYVDVAGGSGELTRALLDPYFGAASQSVVIDPR
jgi:ubiquinone/menaquinone biosynthesis C-methylase UbiE